MTKAQLPGETVVRGGSRRRVGSGWTLLEKTWALPCSLVDLKAFLKHPVRIDYFNAGLRRRGPARETAGPAGICALSQVSQIPQWAARFLFGDGILDLGHQCVVGGWMGLGAVSSSWG